MLHEMDKTFYKKIKVLSDELESRTPYVAAAVEDEIKVTCKHVNIMVSLMKNYKAWVKKPDSAAYLVGKERLLSFANQAPQIHVHIPPCMAQVEIEMSFITNR
jgi:hypothetical protein